jgi:coenzyme F420-reducing hydrogenase gamma subunit
MKGSRRARPRVGVFKFASCDGCQLTLLSCEDELLALADEVEFAHFPEASSRTMPDGPFDLTLVEGSVSTAEQLEELRRIRQHSKVLITIGACATSGGIQALRNFADHEEFRRAVYARPEYVASLATSTAVADHVPVDFELRGCPISKHQLLEVLSAFLEGRQPGIRDESVCLECKRRGTVCVTVARGTPCLGPVTHAGCGAICPSLDRGCYACYGPRERAATGAQAELLRSLGEDPAALLRAFRSFTGNAPVFRAESLRHEP